MRERNTYHLLAAFVVILAGMVVFGMVSGRFHSAFRGLRLLQMASRKYNSGGYEYYMSVPDGIAPEGGWHVVVGLHGLGQRGTDMIWMAENFTEAGAIFVSPTFTGYEPYPGDGPIEPLGQILSEISAEYPVQSHGAVLLGFSMGGTFAFRFSLQHPEQVYGVVTVGAPEYEQDFSSPPAIPYVFTWGELDNLQGRVIPEYVHPLQQTGYNIKTYVVPGYGHEVPPFAIEQALNMIR